ncbi:hypothetical protein ACIRBZ_45840 [Streptomyces sp. NPDC094038]|uniref:hypothetical protein n=1 Tax=Streptomyces sp. NPDC094038 TaxID=3366055 RepID=UPI0038281FF6
MDPDEFYIAFRELIQRMKPHLDTTALTPDTHLWATGFVDSISLLEIVEFIEDLVGHEIELGGEFLQNFTTMRGIHESYLITTVPAAPGTN